MRQNTGWPPIAQATAQASYTEATAPQAPADASRYNNGGPWESFAGGKPAGKPAPKGMPTPKGKQPAPLNEWDRAQQQGAMDSDGYIPWPKQTTDDRQRQSAPPWTEGKSKGMKKSWQDVAREQAEPAKSPDIADKGKTLQTNKGAGRGGKGKAPQTNSQLENLKICINCSSLLGANTSCPMCDAPHSKAYWNAEFAHIQRTSLSINLAFTCPYTKDGAPCGHQYGQGQCHGCIAHRRWWYLQHQGRRASGKIANSNYETGSVGKTHMAQIH
jgi:hypothetical protein